MGKTRRRTARFAGTSRASHIIAATAAEYSRLIRTGRQSVPVGRAERQVLKKDYPYGPPKRRWEVFKDPGFAAFLARRGAEHGRIYDEAHRDGCAPSHRGYVETSAKARRLSDRQRLRCISVDAEDWEDSVWHEHKDGKRHLPDWW